MSIFKKIIDKEIPAKIVYEDELCLAFEDVNPQAPVHILVIPKEEIAMLQDCEQKHQSILGHLLYVSTQVAKEAGLDTGYRVVINNGPDACQTVHHIHLHIMGGRGFAWPPG
jgi:histidine triad (HIT) family protein